MTQYAYFDSTQAAPQPVIGWIDTVAMPGSLGALAPADLLELTSAQWPTAAQRVSGSYAVQNGTLITLAAPALSLAQQAAAMLAAGLAITSTATPALNATYACDPTTRANLLSEMVAILALGTFTNGAATLAWPDITGAMHTFTVAQFKTLATAIGAFVGALTPIAATNAGALPGATATIP